MRLLRSYSREMKFVLRDRSILIWLVVLFCLSSVAVLFGVAEVKQQQRAIDQLLLADAEDRQHESSHQTGWGSAAYYNFHLTYDPPSEFAFAALGQRDLEPWKHRVRMLALEGQIYERDSGNPVTALIGRFDFSFLAAFVTPLILIMLLYDLRAAERTAGRHNLLEATVGSPFSLWSVRAILRSLMVLLSLLLPMLAAGLYCGTSISILLIVGLILFLYICFWTAVCYWVSAWKRAGQSLLVMLMGIWLSVAVIIPAGTRLVIDRLIPLPSGAEILMVQREAVNDAWDLPKPTIMEAFFEHYPQWSQYQPMDSSFDWPWYYALQQLGDQTAAPLSQAYRDGRLQRDRIAGWASWLAPPSLLERSLQNLANTGLASAINYENQVRAFHQELRMFYYAKFFHNAPFHTDGLKNLPQFCPSARCYNE